MKCILVDISHSNQILLEKQHHTKYLLKVSIGILLVGIIALYIMGGFDLLGHRTEFTEQTCLELFAQYKPDIAEYGFEQTESMKKLNFYDGDIYKTFEIYHTNNKPIMCRAYMKTHSSKISDGFGTSSYDCEGTTIRYQSKNTGDYYYIATEVELNSTMQIPVTYELDNKTITDSAQIEITGPQFIQSFVYINPNNRELYDDYLTKMNNNECPDKNDLIRYI